MRGDVKMIRGRSKRRNEIWKRGNVEIRIRKRRNDLFAAREPRSLLFDRAMSVLTVGVNGVSN